MTNTNNVAARLGFERAWKIFYDAWLPSFIKDGRGEEACKQYVNSLKWSQSEVRLEVGLTPTGTNFGFGLTQQVANTSNVQFATEQRLSMQDSLIASEYGIYVAQTAGNNDNTYQLRTYPNTQDFIAADAAALAGAFYSNANFRITCNKDVIMPYRGLWNHLNVPQTQQTAALGAGAPRDQVKPSEDGLITLEPNVLLIGSKGYALEILLQTAMNTATFTNVRAILIFKGWLAQNSTPVS